MVKLAKFYRWTVYQKHSGVTLYFTDWVGAMIFVSIHYGSPQECLWPKPIQAYTQPDNIV